MKQSLWKGDLWPENWRSGIQKFPEEVWLPYPKQNTISLLSHDPSPQTTHTQPAASPWDPAYLLKHMDNNNDNDTSLFLWILTNFYFNLHNNCLMKYDHLCFTGKKTQDREVESLTSSHRAKRQGEGRCRQTGLKLCSVPRVTLSFAGVEDCGIISLNDWSNLMTWGPVLFPFYGCKNWLQKLKWLAPGHTASR